MRGIWGRTQEICISARPPGDSDAQVKAGNYCLDCLMSLHLSIALVLLFMSPLVPLSSASGWLCPILTFGLSSETFTICLSRKKVWGGVIWGIVVTGNPDIGGWH